MTRGYLAALVGVAILLCLPLATVEYPPLVDYPNHLARCFILGNYQAVPQFVAEYVRVIKPLPNLAVDLIVPPLLSFMRASLAGRLFLILEVALFVLGVHVLGKAIHGRATWMALPLAFFVYNSMFLYGFVNYVFGLGVFTLAFGLWLQWRARWTPARLLVSTALALCAFLAHLSAFLFLLIAISVVVTCDGVRRARSMRDLLWDLVPLAPGVVALFVYTRGSGKVGVIIWNTLKGKVVGLLAIVAAYDSNFVAVIAVSSLLLLVLAALLARRITIISFSTLTAGLVMAFLFLVSPLVMFTGSPADARFVVPAALLLLLSVNAELPRNTARVLLIAALALGMIRLAEIWGTWLPLDRRISTEVARFQKIPQGASIFPVFARQVERPQDKLDRVLEHVVCYSIITRRALTPTLLAIPTQQPIRFRQAHRFATLENQDPTLWLRLVPDYDYVWTYGLDPARTARVAESATLISSGQRAALWRVEKRFASMPLPGSHDPQ